MKTKRMQLAVLLVGLVGLGACIGVVWANEHAFGSNTILAKSHPINDDFLVAGSNIQMQAPVKGDVIAAGSNVAISGKVQGDVMAAGGTVTVSGPVSDDVRAAGGTVTVTAPIADNALLAGGNVVLGSAATVGRDAEITAGTVSVQGRIKRNLKLAAGEGRLASEVGGSVEAHTQRLTLMPGAVVRGNLIAYGPQRPDISPQAKVLGRVDFHRVEAKEQTGAASFPGWLGGWLLRFGWLFVIGATLIALSRMWTDRVAETVTRRSGAAILTGFVALLIMPAITVFLMITLIGLPIALLLLAFYGVALLLSGAFVAHTVGGWLLQRLHRTPASPYQQLALGALVVSFLMALPWLGWLVQLIVLFAGFGALVLERWDVRSSLRVPASPTPLTAL